MLEKGSVHAQSSEVARSRLRFSSDHDLSVLGSRIQMFAFHDRRIFVRGVPFDDFLDSAVQDVFAQFGPIKSWEHPFRRDILFVREPSMEMGSDSPLTPGRAGHLLRPASGDERATQRSALPRPSVRCHLAYRSNRTDMSEAVVWRSISRDATV